MLLPEPSPVDDDALFAAYDWPERSDRTWIRGLMAMTLDGTFVGPDGLSGSVSGAGDKQVFAASRAMSDAYLVGAGTIRAEQYQAIRAKPRFAAHRAERGQRSAPTLAVVSARCRFDWSRAPWVASDERPIVLTTEAADSGLRAAAATLGCDVVVAGGDTVELPAALAELGARGLHLLNCEGGPTLLGEIIAHDLMDELALTVSPLVTHAAVPRAPGPVVLNGFSLETLLEQDGYLFGRYVRDAAVTARAEEGLAEDVGTVGGAAAADA